MAWTAAERHNVQPAAGAGEGPAASYTASRPPGLVAGWVGDLRLGTPCSGVGQRGLREGEGLEGQES